MKSQNAEEKAKELQEFIARFSANVAKSKQATSRKKMLSKLKVDDIKPSSRRYPAIIFEREREAGDQILNVDNLSAISEDGDVLFKNVNLNLAKGDKVAIISKDSRATTAFYEIINGKKKADEGEFQWGVTTNQSYLPADNSSYFTENINLVDWLRQWAKTEEEREELDTLGGLVFSLAGRVPVRGELVKHSSGIEIEIVDADPRRVKFLRIHGITLESQAPK